MEVVEEGEAVCVGVAAVVEEAARMMPAVVMTAACLFGRGGRRRGRSDREERPLKVTRAF